MTSGPGTPQTPQDLLADGAEGGVFDGTYVRKGTVASFVRNVQMLRDLPADSAEYRAVVEQLRLVKPALDALDIFEVFALRDEHIATLLADA